MIPRTLFCLLALSSAACGGPGQRALILEADPTYISLRAPATNDEEMTTVAARHCAQTGRQAALRYYRREGSRGDWLYGFYQCL
jgi:hypothetical protein